MWLPQLRFVCLLFAVSQTALAASLFEVLASYPELSELYSRVNASTVLQPLLANANDFTFFAPSNNAIDAFLKLQQNATSDAAFQALIQYSLVKGGFAEVTFTEKPQFVKSNLVDPKYANVTGGQALELVSRNGQPQVVSGNQTGINLEKADLVAAGGVIHIIDQPLTLPTMAVNAISNARLGYFVSILTRGGYLRRETNQYVHEILDSTDVTYFIPNTASALANFTARAANWQQEDFKKGFQYHVIPKYVGYGNSFRNESTFTTVEGANLTIYTNGDDVYVNAAKVISKDILVANGVVHVIEDFLDRNNTSPPLFFQQTTGAENAVPTSSSVPTAAPTVTTTPSSGDTGDNKQTLKIALGAGIGGAAVIVLIALLAWCTRRRRKNYNHALPPPQRNSVVWDGRSTPTTVSDTKRVFINKEGAVQQRPDRTEGIVAGRLADRDSGGPPGYVPPSMVTVTNLERGEAAQRYYGGAKRAESRIETPLRSPNRPNTGERGGYF